MIYSSFFYHKVMEEKRHNMMYDDAMRFYDKMEERKYYGDATTS